MTAPANRLYADIIVPLHLKEYFTYALPSELQEGAVPGVLVHIPFGTGREYAGIIRSVHRRRPGVGVLKEVLALMSSGPLVSELTMTFWEWMADYYMCSVGEVMKAALPSSILNISAAGAKAGSGKRKKAIAGPPEGEELPPLNRLSSAQSRIYKGIRDVFSRQNVALLHGVTSSGKTEIYFHLMADRLRQGRQVLYMVPEIALTTALIDRISHFFGHTALVYHSRLTPRMKSEVWHRVRGDDGYVAAGLVLGVRSSLFLPFRDLGLVVVDEEHDHSYKQQDPAPRYNARDAAIMLADMHGGRVVLGSATPSLESYHNAISGKYSLFELMKRHGDATMPDVFISDIRRATKRKEMVSHFTPGLIQAIDEALAAGEQVILFRNRRGFAPYMQCASCGWIPGCKSCSVNLTYHKGRDRLKCHYCGYTEGIAVVCPDCGSGKVATVGYGTEKIEEELGLIFPDARIDRMDYDTTGAVGSFRRILDNFGNHNTDILVGTQMISKGLDFENLTVVGILHADSLLNHPDFRSHERAFQMMAQVSGRSGRRNKKGKVIIQTADPGNELIGMVLRNDFRAMFDLQMEERKLFAYPPFTRLISVSLRHRDREVLDSLAATMAVALRSYFGSRVLGPEYPLVPRVRNVYVKSFLIKIEKGRSLKRVRQYLAETAGKLQATAGAASLRVVFDVDPL